MPGLYAAGDVVIGLDQISHAMGEGGVAATTIRNDLAKQQAADALGEEGRVDDDPAVLEIGDAVAERDHGALAVGPLDLEDVAGAEILDRDDGAERLAVRAFAGQADQVGMIIFALVQRRQRRRGER